MIYQRYRLGTHATKMCFLGLLDSLISSGLTADGLEHLSGDILAHALGDTTGHVGGDVLDDGGSGHAVLVVTLVAAWTAGTTCSTSVQVGSSCPVIFLPTTTLLVVQSGSAWHLCPTVTVLGTTLQRGTTGATT